MTALQRNLLIAGLLFLCGEFVLLGPYSILTTHDNGEITVPNLVGFEFLPETAFYWYPFSASGVDRLSIGSLSPIDVFLFRHLPGWMAYQVGILSQIGCAVFGVFMLARKALGLSNVPSIFSALAYGFFIGLGGKMFMAVLAYLPFFIFWLGQTLNNQARLFHWGMLSIATVLLALTGHMGFFFPFSQALVVIWFIFIERKSSLFDWFLIVLALAILFALRIQDIIALIETAPITQRLYVEKPEGWDAISTTFKEFTNHFLGNFSAVLFLSLGLVSFYLRSETCTRWRVLWALLSGIAGVFAFSALKPMLASVLPFVKGYNLDRFFGYVTIFYVLLAGIGLEACLKRFSARDGQPRYFLRVPLPHVFSIAAVVGLTLSALPVKYINIWEWISHGNFVHTQQSEVIRNLARRIQEEPMPVRAESYQIYPSYLHAYGIETAGGYLSLIMKRYHSFWAKVIEPSLMRNPDDLMSRDFLAHGYRLMLNTEHRFTDIPFGSLFNLNLLSLANVKYLLSRDRLVHSDLKAIREMPKAWNELTSWAKIKTNFYANFFGREQVFIYENKSVLPRFFLALDFQIFETDAEMLSRLGDSSVQELRRTVFFNRHDLPKDFPSALARGSAGSVNLKNYSPDEIALDVKNMKPRILFAAMSYNPAWRAYIDEKPIALFPANHAFMAIFVPSGEHRVVLRYEPRYKIANPLL